MRGPIMPLLVLMLSPTMVDAGEWQRWNVDAVSGTTRIGCGESSDVIELRDRGYTVASAEDSTEFGEVIVLAEFDDGDLRQVRVATPDCRVPDDAAIELVDRDTEESLDWLMNAVTQHDDKAMRSDLLAAIAHHSGPRATELLREYAASDEKSLWSSAVFWLPIRRGNEGIATVENLLLDVTVAPEKRRDASFSYALGAKQAAAPLLRELVSSDTDVKVRAQAIFALSQTDAPGQEDFLQEIATKDPSTRLRRQALFALSQLDSEAGIEALVSFASNPANGRLRRDALLWLAQSDRIAARKAVEQFATP